MFQYGDKRPVFDVLSPEGTDLSPIMSAIYLFLTMIIVFQVRKKQISKQQDSRVHSANSINHFKMSATLNHCY